MPSRPQPLRIAIDTGGTFTDCVWIEHGRLRMLKVFSTPADPSQAIVEALRKINYEGELVLLHGTTVGTAPSSSIFSLIASSRWFLKTSVSASKSVPPAMEKF